MDVFKICYLSVPKPFDMSDFVCSHQEKQQQEVAELLAANAAGLGRVRQQLRDEQAMKDEQRRLDLQKQQASNRWV